MSKGSKRRPQLADDKHVKKEWERIFPPKPTSNGAEDNGSKNQTTQPQR